jgi:hypothetical protein
VFLDTNRGGSMNEIWAAVHRERDALAHDELLDIVAR